MRGEHVGQQAPSLGLRAARGHEAGEFVGRRERQIPDGVLGRPRERAEEVQEAAVVPGERLVAVQPRVGLEVHPHAAPGDPGVHVHRQVVDRAGGEQVVLAGDVAVRVLGVEHHQVHHGPERAARLPVIADGVQVAQHVLVPVPLVPQRPGQLHLHAPHQVSDGHVGFHAHPQRHDVRDRAGRAAQRCGGAGRDRQAQRDVRGGVHAGQVRREGGDDDRHVGGVGAAGQVGHGGGHLGGEFRADVPARHRGRGGSGGERDGRRQVHQTLRPVLAVGGLPRAADVGALVLGDLLEAQRPDRRRFLPARPRRVQLGAAAEHHHAAVPVEGEVVDVGEQVEVLVGQLDQGGGDEPVAQRVERTGVCLVHPPSRLGLGIVVAAQVQVAGVVVDVGDHPLAGLAVDQLEEQGSGFDLAGGLVAGGADQVGVERAVQVQVLGDGERDVRGELLSEPQSTLTRGHGKRRHRTPSCFPRDRRACSRDPSIDNDVDASLHPSPSNTSTLTIPGVTHHSNRPADPFLGYGHPGGIEGGRTA